MIKAFSTFNPFSNPGGLTSLIETVRCLRRISNEPEKKDAPESTELERILSNLLVAQHTLSSNNKKNGLEMLNWLDEPELYILPNLIKAGSITILNAPLATILQTNSDNDSYLIDMINMLMSGDGIHEHVFLDLGAFKLISENLAQKLIEYADWALAHNHTVNLLWLNQSAIPNSLLSKMESRFKLTLSGQFYLSLPKRSF